jgi:hypothetical protein
VPAVVLVWRSAFGPGISPEGLVGGLLVLVGLLLLCGGGFRLLLGAHRTEADAAEGRWAAVLFRPPVLSLLLGLVLVLCAAVAVG